MEITSTHLSVSEEDSGRLCHNIMHFGRVLRAAGIPIGPGRILDGIRAVSNVGITDKDIFYWALHAVYVNKKEQREIFDQTFQLFWKNPRLLEKMLHMALPSFKTTQGDPTQKEISRRVHEALKNKKADESAFSKSQNEQEVTLDAAMTYSETELLQSMDFEKMSAQEIANAQKIIARMKLSVKEVLSRRFSKSYKPGRVDLRQSLQATRRYGGDYIPLRYKSKKPYPSPIIAICDISGSMNRYSRMLLHFMHVLTNLRSEVHTFLFGTRLSNVTRYLRHKDVDEALQGASTSVEDWSGGTRIGECLHEFNLRWNRRVLGKGAIVLLISDGLDRAGGEGLGKEIERIHRSCHRLIWLNPLLRFEEFSPKPTGVRAILPHVDEFRPIHSLDSLEQLTVALGENPKSKRFDMEKWLEMLRSIESHSSNKGELANG